MHRCDDVINLLTEFLEGDLPPARVRFLEEELAICEPCAEFLATLRRTRDAGRALRCDEVPPACHDRLRELLNLRPGAGASCGRR